MNDAMVHVALRQSNLTFPARAGKAGGMFLRILPLLVLLLSLPALAQARLTGNLNLREGAVVHRVLSEAPAWSAEDLFRAEYRLTEYRQVAAALFETVDALLVPTAPRHPRISEVQDDPVTINSQLGHYTNFVNLLDLAAVALPALPRGDGGDHPADGQRVVLGRGEQRDVSRVRRPDARVRHQSHRSEGAEHHSRHAALRTGVLARPARYRPEQGQSLHAV